MSVIAFKNGLTPAPGQIGQFRFSTRPTIGRHRWQDTKQAPDETAIIDLATKNMLFVLGIQMPPLIQQRIDLAGQEFSQAFDFFCSFVAFCPQLDFLQDDADPIKQRGLIFSKTTAIGDFVSQPFSAEPLKEFMGDFDDSVIWLNLSLQQEAGGLFGPFILPSLFNNLGKLVAAQSMKMLFPLEIMRFAFNYEHDALANYLTNWKAQVAPRLDPDMARSGEELVQRFIDIAATNKDML